MSESINKFLTKIHRYCDESFEEIANLVDNEDWQNANEKHIVFSNSLELYFNMEENVLFPFFEEKNIIENEAIDIVKLEHSKLRNISSQLKKSLEDKNEKQFFEISELFMMLSQQLNIKKEQILYPMIDIHLSSEIPLIIENMKKLEAQNV